MDNMPATIPASQMNSTARHSKNSICKEKMPHIQLQRIISATYSTTTSAGKAATASSSRQLHPPQRIISARNLQPPRTPTVSTLSFVSLYILNWISIHCIIAHLPSPAADKPVPQIRGRGVARPNAHRQHRVVVLPGRMLDLINCSKGVVSLVLRISIWIWGGADRFCTWQKRMDIDQTLFCL